MSYAGAATGTGDHANPIANREAFTGIDFLDHGNPLAAIVKADFDFETVAAVDGLTGVGTESSTCQGTANGGGGAARAAANLIAEEATDTGSDEGAAGAAALNIDRPDRGDGAGPNILSAAGLATRDGVTGEGVLGTGNKKKRHGCDNG